MKPLAFGLLAKGVEAFERGEVVAQVVVERHTVETQIRSQITLLGRAIEVSTLEMVDAPRAERMGGMLGVGRSARQMDVGRVIGAHGGGDVRVVEQPFTDRERVIRARGHEHNVDQTLAGDQSHLLAVVFERLEADLTGMGLGRCAWGAEPERHVGVLGVGEDELPAPVRVGVDCR